MKQRTEYDRLFGPEGIYTSSQVQTLSPYARLVEDLHDAGIDVTRTGFPIHTRRTAQSEFRLAPAYKVDIRD